MWIAYSLVVSAAGGLAYLPIRSAWFVGDDLEEIWGAHRGGRFATQNLHPGRNWRPLNLWIHDVLLSRFGWSPLPFHLVQIGAHIVAALLVAVVVRQLIAAFHRPALHTAPSVWLPLVAGVWFVVAPNHSEAVAWVSARGDVTSTVFVLVAVWCWLRRDRRVVWELAALTSFAVALGFKESAVPLPAVLSVLQVTLALADTTKPSKLLAAAARPWPFYVVVAAYLMARRWSFGDVLSVSLREEFVGDSIPRLLVRSASLVVRTFLPGMAPALWIVFGAGTIALAAVWLAGAVRAGRSAGRAAPDVGALIRRPMFRLVAFSMLAIVILIAPVGHLGASATGPGGERLVYLPSVFAALVVGLVLTGPLLRGRRWSAGVMAIVVLAALMLVGNNRRWDSAADLAESVTDQLAVLPVDRPAYVLDTPGSVDGAYALRLALGPTLVTQYRWAEPPAIGEVTLVRLTSPHERVEVRPGPADRSWIIRLTSRSSSFEQIAAAGSETNLIGVDVVRLGPREVLATLPAGVDPRDVWFVSEGRLRNLAGLSPG